MERIWILLTGLLMLFSQVKAREEAFVVDLPVEPTPTVTMDKRQVPLLEILQELEKQTGIFFSYESSLLDEFPKISFKAQDESLSYCLRRLFSTLPLTYRQTGQIVILKRKPRLYTISGFVRDSVSCFVRFPGYPKGSKCALGLLTANAGKESRERYPAKQGPNYNCH